MKVIINGSLNINNSGGTTIGNSSSNITANTYCKINKNGSININTDPRFGVPYPTNFQVTCGGNPFAGANIYSVSIGGGPTYIIQQGTFPVYADPDQGNTLLNGHHFGGTSITIGQISNANMYVYKNGVEQGGGTCNNPFGGPFIFNFTETDIISISSTDCGD